MPSSPPHGAGSTGAASASGGSGALDGSRDAAPGSSGGPRSASSGSNRGSSSSSNVALPRSPLSVALLLPLGLLLLRAGFVNLLLVLCSTALLLLSPWVRLLLALPDAAAEPQSLRRWDPARFLPQLGSGPPPSASAADDAKLRSGDASGRVRPRAKRPEGMAPQLRRPLDELTELVVRDFICSWYQGQTLSHPSFPRTAHFTIDEVVDSVHARVSASTRSVDLASELLHTTTSVLYTVMRARRANPANISTGLWPNSAARVDALRDAIAALLERHLPREEHGSALVRELLREVATRRLWDLVGAVGEPDFINRKIVEWADKQAEGSGAGGAGGAASPVSHQPVFEVDPALLGQARQEAGLDPMTASPRPDEPVSARTADLLAPSAAASPSRTPLGTPEPGSAFAGPSSSLAAPTTQQPRAHVMGPSVSPAPRTTQPRAMAMPSPVVRSSMDQARPFGTPSRGATPSPVPLADAARRSNELRRSADVDRSGGAQYAAVESQPPPAPTMGPPALPKRTPQPARPAATFDENDVLSGAGTALPMDIPRGIPEPELPESLRASMRDPSAATSSHKRISSVDSQRSASSAQGYTIREDEAPATIAKPPPLPQRTMSPASARSSVQGTPGSARKASSGVPPMPRAPPLTHVLTRSDSEPLSRLRDAFEAWLERGGPVRAEDGLALSVRRGEGEALLRLHIGLSTIARLVPEDGEQAEVFRPDAVSILGKALDSLAEASAQSEVFAALQTAIQRLEQGPSAGGVRESLGPVERLLWARLTGLYTTFWHESHARYAQAAPPTSATDASSSRMGRMPSQDVAGLSYEPRRKPSGAVAGASSVDAAMQARGLPSADVSAPLSYDSAPRASLERAAPGAPNARVPSQAAPPALIDAADSPRHSSSAELPRSATMDSLAALPSSLVVAVTDVSVNAERPNRPVDARTLELMIAVEGLANESGGFVLVRQWSEFEQLEKDLRRTLAQPEPGNNAAAAAGAAEAFGLLDGPGRLPPPPVPLPQARRSTSSGICNATERYLQALLSSHAHVTSAPVRHFLDKTRAGAPAGPRSNALINSLGLGARTFASGVGGLGKTAMNTLQLQGNASAAASATRRGVAALPDAALGAAGTLAALPVAAASGLVDALDPQEPATPDFLTQAKPPIVRKATPLEDGAAAAELRAVTAEARAAQDAQEGKEPPPSAELSQRDLDALLASVFAVADEAFNISGGWTLRRGMLRVLEQVVRANYASSILGVFNTTSSALSSAQLGVWVDELREKYWPDGKWSGAPGEERTPAMRAETARRARAVCIGLAPPQAGYFLGPGGKVSCEKALATVHETITSPVCSLDLALTVTLRLLDVAVR